MVYTFAPCYFTLRGHWTLHSSAVSHLQTVEAHAPFGEDRLPLANDQISEFLTIR